MTLDPILPARRQAFPDLIPTRRHLGRYRQDITLIERRSTPEHLGKDRRKPVVRQFLDRLIPVHPGNAKGAMAPECPVLPCYWRLCEAVRIEQRPPGLLTARHRITVAS